MVGQRYDAHLSSKNVNQIMGMQNVEILVSKATCTSQVLYQGVLTRCSAANSAQFELPREGIVFISHIRSH